MVLLGGWEDFICRVVWGIKIFFYLICWLDGYPTSCCWWWEANKLLLLKATRRKFTPI